VLLDLKDRLALPAQPDLQAFKEPLDLPVLLALPVLQAFKDL
jgi:hypothetical protein